jgi:capping protein (actin filament) muscle Z-line, alpha
VAQVVVCIASTQLSPKNFWNGRVKSRWVLQLGALPVQPQLPQSTQLAGELQVAVHYFEEGNVQLQTSHSCPSAPLQGGADGDIAAWAAACVRQLRVAEAAYFAELESTFEGLATSSFKELRRALPVTRQKYDWAQQLLKAEVKLKDAKLQAAKAAAAAAQ